MRPSNSRGFALLITIVLLAFLVLLLVSLASLTRVETQIATNSRHLAQARQNALTALNIALGELQRFAGADQRATAQADLLPSPQAGARRWTGVWAPTSEPDDQYTNAPASTRLLNWLVSGNESTPSPTVDTNTASGTGHITSAAAAPPIGPDQSVENLTTLSLASDNNLLVNSRPAALLVGGNSVGTTSTDDYVVAPFRNLQVEERTIPGMDPGSSTLVSIGRYAWWIGDEGVKARFFTKDPTYSAAQGSKEWVARVSSSPRAWAGAMTGLGTFPADPSDAANLLPFGHTLSAAQGPLALSSVPATNWRARFHDLSFWSAGVQSDSRQGGLREDLSYLRAYPPSAPTPLLPAALFAPNTPEPSGSTASENPTLEKILSYMEMDTATSPLPARLATPTQQGLYPIIVSAMQIFSFTMDGSRSIYANYYPMVVLANPYDVAIVGSYKIYFRHSGSATTVVPYFNTGEGVNTANGSLSFPINLNGIVGQPLVITNATIGPGEARIFSLSSTAPGLNGTTLSYPYIAPTSAPSSYPGTAASFPMENAFNPNISVSMATPLVSNIGVARIYINSIGGNFNTYLTDENNNVYQYYQQSGDGNVQSGTGANPTPLISAINIRQTRGFRTRFRSSADTTADLRTFADLNWRRNEVRRSITAQTNPYSDNETIRLIARTSDAPANGIVDFVTPLGSDTERALWGRSYGIGGAENLILYRVPRADAPMASVGQLAHAELGFDSNTATYGLGGGIATPNVPRTFSTVVTTRGANTATFRDSSYLLNTAILDRFMVSGMPLTGPFSPATTSFSSNRFTFLPNTAGNDPTDDDLRPSLAGAGVTPSRAFAAHTLVQGAFNVNSTSVEAWKAQLSALNALSYNGSSAGSALPRTPFQSGTGTDASTTNEANAAAWSGYRRLTSGETTLLATKIVDRIKARGAPSTNLGRFVSRSLSSDAEGLRGILQGAIDDAALNDTAFPSSGYVNVSASPSNPRNDLYPAQDDAAEAGPRNMGIPGWLAQHDVVSLLAPVMQTRSDTFLIRVAGDVMDPLNPSSTTPLARAWCEAVVQRIPEYTEPADNATKDISDGLTALNIALGRRFKIVSFRWLTASDI